MIEIKVPPTPGGLPEEHAGFRRSFIHWIDNERRLAAPVSRQVVAMRLLDAIEVSQESGSISLRDDDHALVCQMLETSETSFLPQLVILGDDGKPLMDPETGKERVAQIHPAVSRFYLRAILSAKPVELAQAAE